MSKAAYENVLPEKANLRAETRTMLLLVRSRVWQRDNYFFNTLKENMLAFKTRLARASFFVLAFMFILPGYFSQLTHKLVHKHQVMFKFISVSILHYTLWTYLLPSIIQPIFLCLNLCLWESQLKASVNLSDCSSPFCVSPNLNHQAIKVMRW